MRLFAPATLALFALLTLTGCNKLTMDNYQRLKAGQTFDEVVAIIGQPTKCDETVGIRQCQWGNDSSGISGNFVADKALLFSARNLK